MAWYKDLKHLAKSTTEADHWNKTYGPADDVPVSGIYKCLGCTKEITSNAPDKFPPQNKHQHDPGDGEIKWKLIVRTNTQGTKNK
jgi:DNA-binding MltR family transcriptional regulator